ncbi:PLP-dependent aminotransferase family protein [Paludibacterium yongneupense]|uniref:aminotransferase-like domain-containing protein n=1 Tax=Paludibacterium yongneupense TaxID=400061 RepID=UPI00040B80E8|nr:PLP-dependent aminotransferase family protein [Paludibacterium yongneupense]
MTDTAPLYLRIAHDLCAQLDDGRLPPGSRLPSVRALAAHHGVNALTALQAYRHLERLQRVVARPRTGFYAALSPTQKGDDTLPPWPAPATLVDLGRRASHLVRMSDPSISVQLHMAEAAAALYPGQAIARLLQQRLRHQPELIGTHLSQAVQRQLQHQLQRLAAGFQLELDPAAILLTHGNTESIQLALRALTRPGDTVAVETPVYFGLLQTLESLGLKALEIPCTPERGISLEALEFALRHGSAVRCLVVVPHFQNPGGGLMPDGDKKRLLDLLRQHHVPLIEDDVFGDLHFGADRPTPIKAWDNDGDVIYCASFTKSLAPSFRQGWVAGGKHQARLAQLKLSSSYVGSALLQAALADFLSSGLYDRHLGLFRRQLSRQCQQLTAAVLAAFPLGTRVSSPRGGLLLWIECPRGVDSVALLQQALAESISFAPGPLFSAEPRFASCLRLNFGQPWSEPLAAAIARLGQLALAQLRAGHGR